MNKLAIFRHVLEASMADSERFNPVAGTAFDQQKRQAELDRQTNMLNKQRAAAGQQPLRRRIVPSGDVFSGLERSINNRLQGPTARQQLQESLATGRQMLGQTGQGVRRVIFEPPQPVGMTGPRTQNPNERAFKTVTNRAYQDPKGADITVTTTNPDVFAHEAGHVSQHLRGVRPPTQLADEMEATRLANRARGYRSPDLNAAYGTYIESASGIGAHNPLFHGDPASEEVWRQTHRPQSGSFDVKARAQKILDNPRSVRQRRFAEKVMERVTAREQPNLSAQSMKNPLLAPQLYGPIPPLNPLHEQHIDAAFGPGAARDAYARAEQIRAQNLAYPRPEIVAAYRNAGQKLPMPEVPAGQTIIPPARPQAVGLRNFLKRMGR